MAGVVALARDERLHDKCAGCIRANWKRNRCKGYTSPQDIWAEGKCWAWEDEELRAERAAARQALEDQRAIEEYESQFQQARCPGPWEDPLAWLAATHPPSIRDKEAIMHLRGGHTKGSSKSGRKRKKPPKFYTNPFLC